VSALGIMRLFHIWAFGARGAKSDHEAGLPIHAIGGDELIEHMRLEDAAAASFLAGYRIAQEQARHAVALAFWQGVCAERATEADDRAERRGEDAKFYGRVGNAIKAILAQGSVGFARTAATKLRAWALAEVPRG